MTDQPRREMATQRVVSPLELAVGWGLAIGSLALIGVVAWAWLMPVEYFQDWAFRNSNTDPYRQFEAVGRAEAACWLARFFGPLAIVVLAFGLNRVRAFSAFLQNAFSGLGKATQNVGPTNYRTRLTTVFIHFALCGWLVVAGWQWAGAIDRRLTDWPYYRFRSGAEVLPNISDANRDVIRYILSATPPNSRILVVSDQKLFFLSYYLLPRRLYHKIHPDSEFVIPLAHQERQMAAYQLRDIDPNWINEKKFDFVLEYFEHPTLVDKAHLRDDEAWIQFMREARRDPAFVPTYAVRLTRLGQQVKP